MYQLGHDDTNYPRPRGPNNLNINIEMKTPIVYNETIGVLD